MYTRAIIHLLFQRDDDQSLKVTWIEKPLQSAHDVVAVHEYLFKNKDKVLTSHFYCL